MPSVLTFILLVVLGGGIGLLVVSLAESTKPTAEGSGTERADADPEPEPEPDPEPVPEPVLEPVPEPVLEPSGGPPRPQAVIDVPQNGEVAPPPPRPYELGPPRRRRIPADVPRSQVAIEGSYADVARPPLWRRVVAVVGIAGITVVSGIVIAVVCAAAIGAAAELVNTAIG